MGNVSGRSEEGENSEAEEGETDNQHMILHSPPRSLTTAYFQPPPASFTSQVPVRISGETTMQGQYHSQGAAEKLNPVMITWGYDGSQVALTGSWDNWDTREPLQRSGKDFMVMKLLPSGVYHYRFIVDENLRFAPELPWECDDSGIAYNVLNVQDNVPEAPESLTEFQAPSSPSSSYGTDFLNHEDFSKPPPEIPPQLQLTLLHERFSTVDGQQSLPRPVHAVLNHLYIQNNAHGGRGQPAVVALGSTHRFLQKYVTVVLYKPSSQL
ncbi:unnamed protein product [Linum tenue]|uniref:Association with the SNF1 complex (ASC) domain-containing protein n=1 Tax=Linum tenue TaxID=586396 RepID=A0AAV0LES3_9ROSI|nr:unnamed protein product [Linum tenue]